MKFLTILFSTLILTLSTSANAETKCDTDQLANVKVNGMVCDFCARALEKVFGREDAVNDIQVDMNTGIVTVDIKAGETVDDDKLKKLVRDSGYNVEEINRECKA